MRRSPTRRTILAAAALTASGIPAAAAAAPLRLSRGVNTWPWFSLTREFPAPRTDYGTPPFQEGRPVPSGRDLTRLRSAGFDFLRLPVDPGPFVSAMPEERVRLMRDLKEAVESALRADLSVLVNVQANGATHHWNPQNFYGDPGAALFPAYRSFVSALAHMLDGIASERLALEPVNEPPQGCGSDSWLAIQDDLLTEARRVAPRLTLVACGACGSMITGLTALDPKPLARFAPLLFTFHYYEPYLFSHQGAPWMREPVYRALNAVPWPASAGTLETTLAAVRARMAADATLSAEAKREAYTLTEAKLTEYFAAQPDKRYLSRHLAMVGEWGRRHGIASERILLGEFGALRSDARYVASRAEDRARYVRDVREAAEAEGFPWAFWNLFDGMGVMDDASRRFDPAIVTALGLRVPAGDP
ncbi:cellulase family glycosylhydrolase [Methylobacterium sp. 77]|uniref:glycoside hydrolase family 5 protein n=1 Tax=Methylobacterium sp. 77 TaxID=1101192 RepID=UPI0003A7F08C|nr:cellulase family glycosylhydrolase [Methylobacterium sp. 77]